MNDMQKGLIMCLCTPEIRTPYCGKPGCEWPTQPGKRDVFRDEQLDLLDDLADLCEYWKRCRGNGRTPNALRSALVMLATDIAKTTIPANERGQGPAAPDAD